MIGLDANVLVRYLAQDDPAQSAVSRRIIEQRLNAQNPGYISLVVMVETAWVLTGSYRLSSTRLADVLERLLQIETLVIENEQAVFTALSAVREGTGDFADALIGTLNSDAGCRHTLTFDRKAARLPGFESAR